MKRLFILIFLFNILNSQDLEKQSGFIVGIEASFGSPISYEGNPESLSAASIMGGLYSGYQYYFDQNFGIKILFGIHDGTPIIAKFDKNIKISAIPFWVGGRADLLWDFWQSQSNSIGINVGIEYASETYHSREAKINESKQTLNPITQHNLYPLLGFYYRYKKYQISLDYRFNGALKPKSQAEIIDQISFYTKYSFNESLNLSWFYWF